MKHKKLILSSLVGLALVACAHLQPGADPLIVRAEQTQTIAKNSFQLVLSVDHSDRGLWRSNAPAFHAFCEWLRQPIQYPGREGTPAQTVPRDVMMLLQLDDIKTDYKASRSSSNTLAEAIATVASFGQQASAWSVIVTNSAYKVTR